MTSPPRGSWAALTLWVLVLCSVQPLGAQYAVDATQQLAAAEARRALALRTQQSAAATGARVVDVTYYALDIRVDGTPQVPKVSGNVLTVARVAALSTNTVTFDLSSPMIVDSVRVDGVAPASTIRTISTFEVHTARTYLQGETIAVRIYYHGYPIQTGFGSFGAKPLADGVTPWYWTLSEPYGARDWWPCIDHPSDKADSLDVSITCRQPLIGVSQGVLTGTLVNPDTTRTFQWKHRYPIATYLVSVTISNFNSFTDWYHSAPTDSMPVVNYVTPDIDAKNPSYRANAALTPGMLSIYASLFGEYPFVREKYGHVEFGWSGGMEHQTLTSLGTYAFSVGTISHELAHQWFGDLITCRTWPDLWLNEGFATYCEALYQERAVGSAAYWNTMLPKMNNSPSGAKFAVGSLRLQDTSSVGTMFGTALVYNKGGTVLHMLRHVLGDSVFFQAMKAYALSPSLRYSTASTEDFRAVCEQISGRDLGYFFNEWVLGQGYPHYVYSYAVTSSGQGVDVAVRIQQTVQLAFPTFFTMPVDLKFTGSGMDTTVTVFNDASDQTLHVALPVAPTAVQFDPMNWILRDVSEVAASVSEGFIPGRVTLAQNFPNPFNPATRILYDLPSSTRITLTVFDVLGRPVALLDDGVRSAGLHEVQWDASAQPSGVYFYRLTAGTFSQTRSMVLVK